MTENRELSWDVAREVLRTLAYHGLSDNMKKYDIAKESNLAESTVYREVPKMVELKPPVVKEKKLEKEAPDGQKLKAYRISLFGLVLLLGEVEAEGEDEGLWGDIGEIAPKQGHLLPLIFAKWESIEEEIKDEITERLKGMIIAEKMYLSGQNRDLVTGEKIEPKGETSKSVRHRLYRNVLSSSKFLRMEPEKKSAWMRTVKNDEQLTEYVLHRFSLDLEHEQSMMENRRKVIEILEDDKAEAEDITEVPDVKFLEEDSEKITQLEKTTLEEKGYPVDWESLNL